MQGDLLSHLVYLGLVSGEEKESPCWPDASLSPLGSEGCSGNCVPCISGPQRVGDSVGAGPEESLCLVACDTAEGKGDSMTVTAADTVLI